MSDPSDEDDYARVWAESLRDVQVPMSLLMEQVETMYLDDWARSATQPKPNQKNTSAKAAREICAVAAVCLATGRPLPEAVRLYLARVLRAVAEGDFPNHAFGIAPKRGVSIDPVDQTRYERVIAGCVTVLVRKGLSPPEAKEQAAMHFECDTRLIELYWDAHRETIDTEMLKTNEREMLATEVFRHLAAMSETK